MSIYRTQTQAVGAGAQSKVSLLFLQKYSQPEILKNNPSFSW